MHEPLACGALPAQHSRWHIDPADTDAIGAMPDKNAVSSTDASRALAVLINLSRLELARSIRKVEERILARRAFARKYCLRVFAPSQTCVKYFATQVHLLM
jgi:hypothetical protein